MQNVQLNNSQFTEICHRVYGICGIHLKSGKKALVQARLMKRLRALGLPSFDEYMNYLDGERGKKELGSMVDAITTNKTSFFREADHFKFLADHVLPNLMDKRIRMWSAACSSGQEPYSMAMVVRDNVPNLKSKDIRILATDISYQMLEISSQAIYDQRIVADLPNDIVRRHFQPVSRNGIKAYQVKSDVRALVQSAWLNLMDKWPMKGPFDVIFCRNVMIYFDKKTQERLINRFWNILAKGGYFFVGHSEGLSGIKHRFQYICPATYKK